MGLQGLGLRAKGLGLRVKGLNGIRQKGLGVLEALENSAPLEEPYCSNRGLLKKNKVSRVYHTFYT